MTDEQDKAKTTKVEQHTSMEETEKPVKTEMTDDEGNPDGAIKSDDEHDGA